MEISDRVAVMYAGRVVEIGSLRDVVKRPAHPYTEGPLSSTTHGSRRGTRLEAIPGAPPRLDHLPPGCAFAPRCEVAEPRCSAGEVPLIPLEPGRGVRCVRQAAVAAE